MNRRNIGIIHKTFNRNKLDFDYELGEKAGETTQQYKFRKLLEAKDKLDEVIEVNKVKADTTKKIIDIKARLFSKYIMHVR